MKISTRHSSVLIEPVLGVTPEAFDAVEMVSAFGHALVFGHDHVLARDREARVSAPVVRVVERADSGVVRQQRQQSGAASTRDREGEDLPIALINAEDHHFACRTPATLAVTRATKESFIGFDHSGQRLTPHLFQRSRVDRLADSAVDALDGGLTETDLEAQAVGWYAQDEVAHQLLQLLARGAQTGDERASLGQAPGATTPRATPASVAQKPPFVMCAERATPRHDRIVT